MGVDLRVPPPRVSPVGKVNEVRKPRGFACRHFMCPGDQCKSQIRNTAIILENPSQHRAIMSGVLWHLGEMNRKQPVTPHSLSKRGHIWHVRVPWDGKQGPCRGFPIRPTVEGFFNFGVPKRVFFVKQLQGAHLSIARDLRAVIGDRLRTTYHMPYAHASHLGNPAASYGAPPNPLEN